MLYIVDLLTVTGGLVQYYLSPISLHSYKQSSKAARDRGLASHSPVFLVTLQSVPGFQKGKASFPITCWTTPSPYLSLSFHQQNLRETAPPLINKYRLCARYVNVHPEMEMCNVQEPRRDICVMLISLSGVWEVTVSWDEQETYYIIDLSSVLDGFDGFFKVSYWMIPRVPFPGKRRDKKRKKQK